MLMMTLVMMTSAEANADAPISGQYNLADSPAQLAQFKQDAVERTLSSMSFALRVVARSRVEAVVMACAAYDIQLEADVMRVTCDSRPTITLNLGGSPSRFTNAQGQAYVVTASRDGDRITAMFSGPEASQTVIYTFGADSLVVDKTIDSAHFGTPLEWENSYQRR
jgi:hypothetical protein